MRFHLGPVPEDPEFDPEVDGWIRLREPRPGVLLRVAIPLGMLMAASLLFVWSLIVPFGGLSGSFSLTITLPGLLVATGALIGFVLVHEALHAVPAMLVGSLDGIVVGFWPRHLAPYVAYTGALSREAQLVSGVMPLVLLTGLPLALGIAIPAAVWWMVGLSVVNVLGSAADLIMLGLIAHQVPRGATIRNQGFATWWRPAV